MDCLRAGVFYALEYPLRSRSPALVEQQREPPTTAVGLHGLLHATQGTREPATMLELDLVHRKSVSGRCESWNLWT